MKIKLPRLFGRGKKTPAVDPSHLENVALESTISDDEQPSGLSATEISALDSTSGSEDKIQPTTESDKTVIDDSVASLSVSQSESVEFVFNDTSLDSEQNADLSKESDASEHVVDGEIIQDVDAVEDTVDEQEGIVETVDEPINDTGSEALPVEDKPLVLAFRAEGKYQKRHRFGEYVYRQGLISKDALHAASLEQEVTGLKMGQILVSNGFLSDKDRVEAILATEHSRISEERVTKCRIPVDILSENNIMISAEQEDRIYVATSEDERMVKMIVNEYYPEKTVEMVSYDASRMNLFLAAMRKMTSIDDPQNSEELMLDRIVYAALTQGASDIHIEPKGTTYSILFRVEGVRFITHTGNMTEYQVLIAKIKDKASMDLAERRKPQDGGFQMEYAGKMLDLRVATVPVASGGEKCTIRLLDSDRVQPSLEKLGISEVTKWRKALSHQHGLCIICGPTGSGKTTTLNASIREMDRFGKAIYSIEDPVEYRIPYVSQVAVNNQVGLDFATAIRSFLRSDPDVMIVGEVRDAETASIAVKAAETGHLVIATLHTGTISGVITRLRELGVAAHELPYLVRAIMVQSLVRTTCTACKGKEPEKSDCKACEGKGYKGRTVVSECEYFEGPKDVQAIIPGDDKHIVETWTTKEQDAVNKMYAGITDIEELRRVFGPSIDRYLEKDDTR